MNNDNLEPIDYSWAFLPLALGIFSLKKNYFDLTVVLFGISIGTRIYFIVLFFQRKLFLEKKS